MLNRMGLALAGLVFAMAGCSARDPVDKTPVFHVGTPTNRSSVNSWEIGSGLRYTLPGASTGRPVHLKPIPSQRGFEPDDPLALAVLEALNHDGSTSTTYLSASAKNGVVVLVGGVPNARQKAQAERIARHVPGVKTLHSRIEVMP